MTTPHPRPWYRGSVFGDGLRRPLDRNQRARFRFLVDAHHRTGRITRTHRDVGLALLKRHGVDGRCDPAHSTLAADADCSERTVRRATSAMRDVGLLHWQTRLVRAGWRAEQTSNSYELIPTLATPAPRPCCGGQDGRGTRKEEVPLLPSADDVAAAQAALARRRAAVEGKMLLNKRGSVVPAN